MPFLCKKMYMLVLAVAHDEQKEELLQGKTNTDIHIEWVAKPEGVKHPGNFDACIDLLFQNTEERVQLLQQLHIPLIIVNSVITPLTEIQGDFIRINGWNTFLKRPIFEAACNNASLKEKTEIIFSGLRKKIEWVPDIPGFITARIIASIINEAYFALEEKVSGKEEIDTAMKLGTNYPYGPFEWSEMAGLKNIHSLLNRLAKEEKRYEPAPFLIKEASV